MSDFDSNFSALFTQYPDSKKALLEAAKLFNAYLTDLNKSIRAKTDSTANQEA